MTRDQINEVLRLADNFTDASDMYLMFELHAKEKTRAALVAYLESLSTSDASEEEIWWCENQWTVERNPGGTVNLHSNDDSWYPN